jgi:hypothetical protein
LKPFSLKYFSISLTMRVYVLWGFFMGAGVLGVGLVRDLMRGRVDRLNGLPGQTLFGVEWLV